MSHDVTEFLEGYAERYMAGDADAIAAMCEVPFLAVRHRAAIHLTDRGAIVAHFATNIAGYQGREFRTSCQMAGDPLRILSYVNHDVRPMAGT